MLGGGVWEGSGKSMSFGDDDLNGWSALRRRSFLAYRKGRAWVPLEPLPPTVPHQFCEINNNIPA